MAEYYRVRFTILDEDAPGAELLRRVSKLSQQWADDQYLAYTGGSEEPRTDGAEIDGLACFSLLWELTDGWRLSLRLSTKGDDVEADVEVRALTEAEDSSAPPDKRSLAYSPSLIRELFDRFDCRIDSEPLESKPQRLTVEDAGEFVRETLLSPDRRLPVVVVSEDYAGSPSVDPQFVQSRLFGLAKVFTYDDDTALAVNKSLPRHRCYGGAVRVYGPGFSAEDPANQHKIWLGADAKNLRERWFEVRDALMTYPPAKLEASLYEDVFGRISRRKTDALIERLRQANRDKDAAKELLGDRGAAEELLEDLNKQLQDSQAENSRLRKYNRQLTDDNRTLAWEKSQLLARLGDIAQAAPAADDDPPEFHSVSSVVDRAASTFGELRFTNSALKSAAESRYRRPKEIWPVFEAMRDCAIARCGGAMGEDVKDWFGRRGVDFAPNESRPTMERYGSERVFDDVVMEEHFKLGGGRDPQNHLRIHASWDGNRGKWLIGYIGSHLPIVSG